MATAAAQSWSRYKVVLFVSFTFNTQSIVPRLASCLLAACLVFLMICVCYVASALRYEVEFLGNMVSVNDTAATSIKANLTSSTSVRVRQVTTVGAGPWSDSTQFIFAPNAATIDQTVIIVVITSIGTVAFLVVIIMCDRQRRNKLVYSRLVLPVADDWEIETTSLQVTEEIGSGLFGVVYYGTVELLDGSIVEVAVKECREGAELREKQLFIEEAQVCKHVCAEPHPNIIRLIGVCMQAQPLRILLEFARFGDLRSYLQRQRFSPSTLPGPRLTTWDKVRVVTEILAAMHWISAHDVIHRDLAARNVLLTDGLTAKLSDFGMSRSLSHEDVRFFCCFRVCVSVCCV
jgi:hypothetical protein